MRLFISGKLSHSSRRTWTARAGESFNFSPVVDFLVCECLLGFLCVSLCVCTVDRVVCYPLRGSMHYATPRRGGVCPNGASVFAGSVMMTGVASQDAAHL